MEFSRLEPGASAGARWSRALAVDTELGLEPGASAGARWSRALAVDTELRLDPMAVS
jgi:hypothetical protein